MTIDNTGKGPHKPRSSGWKEYAATCVRLSNCATSSSITVMCGAEPVWHRESSTPSCLTGAPASACEISTWWSEVASKGHVQRSSPVVCLLEWKECGQNTRRLATTRNASSVIQTGRKEAWTIQSSAICGASSLSTTDTRSLWFLRMETERPTNSVRASLEVLEEILGEGRYPAWSVELCSFDWPSPSPQGIPRRREPR